MSLQFSNTTTKGGMIQIYEKNTGLDYGTVSGSANKLAEATTDINLGLSKAWSLIFSSNGTWQWDDTNHTSDYPIIKTNLVSGQRDYAFLTDNTGNLILDIYKVMVKQPGGLYKEIYPVDSQSDRRAEPMWDGVNTPGVPDIYDKTANGIFLDPIPNSSVYTDSDDLTEGLMVYINREGSFFTSSDTTKKPGFSGLFHEYPVLYASYKYASRNGLKNKNDLYTEMINMENALKKHYRRRERDVQDVMEAERICSV